MGQGRLQVSDPASSIPSPPTESADGHLHYKVIHREQTALFGGLAVGTHYSAMSLMISNPSRNPSA